MLIDITLKITPKMVTDAQGNEKKALVGHLGTHFDVMNKEFPLEYTKRKAIVFDISGVEGRDIGVSDVDLDSVKWICSWLSIPVLLKRPDTAARNISRIILNFQMN